LIDVIEAAGGAAIDIDDERERELVMLLALEMVQMEQGSERKLGNR
jgi:hypothetical protein